MGHPAAALSHTSSYSFSTTIEDHSFFSVRPVTSSRIEIVCIEEGAGFFITGTDRTAFKSGDVIMVGTHLCHQYKLDAAYDGAARDRVKVSVLRFLPDFWGETFLNLSENAYVKILLSKADLGIMPEACTSGIVRRSMARMMDAAGTSKIILLLEILHAIAVSSALRFLSLSQGVSHGDELDRMELVYQYSRTNFYRRIDLEEIAAVAYVSPNSFCRWFKARAQKTYSRFLIELRVRHACRLLVESRLCAKKICMESGFNNFSNFHKCFKEVTGKSPMEYQKEFRSVALFG
jgi:AraC-like DNA-binding protein